MTTRFEAVRSDFPALEKSADRPPLVYLDNAATTQRPRQVLDALQAVYTRYNANVHRSTHGPGQAATELYEAAHRSVARFIGAASQREIVFTRNTTESLNLLAVSMTRGESGPLRLAPGDEVVITRMEHHSNLVPWQALCREAGLALRVLEVAGDGSVNLGGLSALLGRRTRLVCCAHVSNVLGTISPISQIARLAHDAGALLVVDAAQSVPAMPVNVQELGCDFLAFSGHKMLAPFGIGVLYGREDLLSRLAPFLYGGDMIESVTVERSTWNSLPWKFEAGTPDVAAAVALGGASDRRTGEKLFGAVDYLEALGMEQVRGHELSLLERLMEGIPRIRGARVYGPAAVKDRAAVVSFSVEDADPFLVARLLDNEGVCVRAGGLCAHPLVASLGVEAMIRVSPYIYNTVQEIDFFLETLEDIVHRKLI
jgi:cysteine desulfurase / selenocysteine lyase